jgi:hypothetical protein
MLDVPGAWIGALCAARATLCPALPIAIRNDVLIVHYSTEHIGSCGFAHKHQVTNAQRYLSSTSIPLCCAFVRARKTPLQKR